MRGWLLEFIGFVGLLGLFEFIEFVGFQEVSCGLATTS